MLYQIVNGTVSAGGETILSRIHFEIRGKEKIAVVGRNGAGKTTLLRLLGGELDLDREDKISESGVFCARSVTIGMLHQSHLPQQDKTVEEIMLEACPHKDDFSRERFAYEMEYHRIFTGFGFQLKEEKRKLASFSGGEQTKISLIRLLLMKPDILLLDEPTNHLDIPTAEWLEEYMRHYEKAAVFVSHDRFFLDQVVDVVYELQNKKLKKYVGNYSQYRVEKHKEIQQQWKSYQRQQAELARLDQLVEKFKHKPKKAAFARSRKTMMNRMERVEKPDKDEAHIFVEALEPKFPGSKWVFEAEHLKIGYEKALLELSLRVRRGQKIGIIGDNGVGKTTFLKTIAGQIPPVGGAYALGNHTMMGYFDQQSASITSEKQVVEHFHDLFPGMTEKEVRQTLGAYLFAGRDASKKVDSLSGGEKARLVLAELLHSRPNLLVLDEPTNHMDIWAKETLESAFRAYTGTILFVSHDRYFIQRVADAILVFEGEQVKYYPFGYEHYLKRSRQGQGEQLSAMIRAEDQALLADLKAVPKAERHRLRECSTEEVYLDWKLRLAQEPMEQAKAQVAIVWEQWIEFLEYERDALWNLSDDEEETVEELGSRHKALQQKMEAAWDQWTQCCLDWVQVYQESDSLEF